MVELDDLSHLAQYDSQEMLARADRWPQRLEAIAVAQDIATVDAAWLDSCRSPVPLAANPAKQVALRLFERVPLIWSHAHLAPVAQQWQARIQHYAEAVALSATLDEMALNWSMVRYPRFWSNAVTCVYLFDGSEPAATHDLTERLKVLLQTRRTPTIQFALPTGWDRRATLFHGEAMGEWVALYLAALYQVDPAARVAWDFLALANRPYVNRPIGD